MFKTILLTLVLQLAVSSNVIGSNIPICLDVASAIAAQQGLSVERPDVPGSIIITGSLEGEEYKLILRFADIAGQLALSSAANSKATILDARTLAEREFYAAFWDAIQPTGVRIIPVQDYATNAALLAPLLGTKTHGDIVALETVDGHVVVANLSEGAPHPTKNDWGSFEAAGFGFESFETTYHLYWMVTLASDLEGEFNIEVDEVTGPSTRGLIRSRISAREGKLSARSPGFSIDKESFPFGCSTARTVCSFSGFVLAMTERPASFTNLSSILPRIRTSILTH